MINIFKNCLPEKYKFLKYIEKTYDSGWQTYNEPMLREPEKRFEAYLGVKNLQASMKKANESSTQCYSYVLVLLRFIDEFKRAREALIPRHSEVSKSLSRRFKR